MQITNYIKSLLPSFTKNRVIDDARVSYSELQTKTIASYAEAEKFFHSWKFRSSEMKDFITTYNRIVKNNSSNIIVGIGGDLSKILESKDFIQDKIETIFETNIVSAGISSVKANILRILEAVSFVSDYSLLFLNYVYILETSAVSKETKYVRESLSPADIDYLQKNFTDFCLALNAIAKDSVKFQKAVNEIPDVLIDPDNSSAIVGTVGEDKLDPLILRNFSSSTMNPIYHIRMMFAEREVARYKRNDLLKKNLQMRLLNLNMLLEDGPDAKIQQEINYNQDRINVISHQMQKTEEGL